MIAMTITAMTPALDSISAVPFQAVMPLDFPRYVSGAGVDDGTFVCHADDVQRYDSSMHEVIDHLEDVLR